MTGRLILAVCIAVALAGCSQEHADLQQFVAQVRSQPTPPIEPAPTLRPYIPYKYTTGKRPSPFLPAKAKQTRKEQTSVTDNDIHPDRNRTPDPLEAFSLDSLRMVGTLTANGTQYALVQAPDNIVHRVRVGDHAGHHYGEITSISRTRIELTELVSDNQGGYTRKTARLQLAQ